MNPKTPQRESKKKKEKYSKVVHEREKTRFTAKIKN
jgi:hypothetical protein